MSSAEYGRFIRHHAKKVFASFCRASQSDAYVFLRWLPAGWNDRLASPKAVRGDETTLFCPGIVQLA
jgi:hypothetical protein